MKKLLLSCLLLMPAFLAQAAKTVFIPTEFTTDPYLSTWSNTRSYQSANFVIFWGSVVGNTPATYSDPNLAFNPQSVCDTLEKVYVKYIHDIKFCSDDPSKNLGKYKIIIVMNDTWGTGGPTGWAFGGSYDNTIGAMWVHPNATRDGGVISHEFAHTLQGMISIQENTTGGGFNTDATGFFWECHANYMRTQMYPRFASDDLPRWTGTSMFHWSSTRHHYDSFKLLWYIQQQDSIGMVNNLWKLSTAGEHPLMTYRRLKGWTQSQLNDFVFGYASHEVTADYPINNFGLIIRTERDRLKAQEPHYLWRMYTMLSQIDSTTGRYIVPNVSAPQDYGYNVIPLYTTCSTKTVTIKFKGHTEVNATAGWRYGFVTSLPDGTISRYSPVYSSNTAEVSFTMNAGEDKLYFVVLGAPTTHTSYAWERGYPKIKRYPYELSIANAVPEGYQSTYRSEYKVNGHAHSNGGGWVANTATVAATAYVGPKALVLGTSVISGNAHIDGNAWVENATVGNTVVINGNTNVWGGSYTNTAQILENAILNNCTITGAGTYKGDCMEWGVTFGNTLTVGGDAELGNCSTPGVYLQVAHPNNGRTDCDGKGATDTSNVDVNSTFSNFTAAQMAFSTAPGCAVAVAPVAGKIYKITNKNSGKSFCIRGVSTADDARLIQYVYQDGDHQHYKVEANGTNFRLTPMHVTTKALSVYGSATADGTNITQYTWSSTAANQQFTFVNAGSGYYNIKSTLTGKCMGVDGSSLLDDAEIKQYACSTTAANELFTFEEVPTTAALLTAVETVEDVHTTSALSVYPNPASGTFTVSIKGMNTNTPTGVVVGIYDVSGKDMYRQPWKNVTSRTMSTSALHLKPGVFFVKATDNKTTYTQKLVVTE